MVLAETPAGHNSSTFVGSTDRDSPIAGIRLASDRFWPLAAPRFSRFLMI